MTVVPEIDLPGHSAALLAAVPELATSVAPVRSHPDAFASLRPATISPVPSALELIGELLGEVASAVGGPYLHVGGDEADLSEWESAPEVIEHRKTLALPDVAALRRHVNQTLASTVLGLDRLPIFWDEAFAAGGLDGRALVMSWRGESIGLRAAEAGHKVIMAPVDPTYLDYAEIDSADEPVALGYGNDLRRLAAWAPPGGGPSRIIGCHAPIWTEAVPDARLLDYRVFPRLCVLAQAGWSGRPDRLAGKPCGAGTPLRSAAGRRRRVPSPRWPPSLAAWRYRSPEMGGRGSRRDGCDIPRSAGGRGTVGQSHRSPGDELRCEPTMSRHGGSIPVRCLP